MDLFFVLLGFIIGAAFGSFICVLADRLPRGENVLVSRSKCVGCNRKLMAGELIPIVSYLLQGGKCRHCHSKIPFHLFVAEAVSGIYFAALFFAFIIGLLTLPTLIFSSIIYIILAAIFIADFEYGIIPDQLTIALILITAIFIAIFTPQEIINHVLTGIVSFGLFFALFYATHGRGMGFGDVKLALALGFLLGFPAIIAGLYGAFLTGAAISIILILWGKKKLHGDSIPFGPFLVASALVSFFWGEQILQYFLTLL